jgi:hypothetical protein
MEKETLVTFPLKTTLSAALVIHGYNVRLHINYIL